jgi:hypothetical protein
MLGGPAPGGSAASRKILAAEPTIPKDTHMVGRANESRLNPWTTTASQLIKPAVPR